MPFTLARMFSANLDGWISQRVLGHMISRRVPGHAVVLHTGDVQGELANPKDQDLPPGAEELTS